MFIFISFFLVKTYYGRFTEKINLDDLYTTQKSIEDNKIKIYQKILARVHKKIKTTGRSRNCEKHCFFLVPEFVLGILL